MRVAQLVIAPVVQVRLTVGGGPERNRARRRGVRLDRGRMSGPLTVVDMHTGGEPLRIVTSGYPDLPKGTILEKRAHVRDHLDHLRKILMFEPRGHADMYGALLVEPDLPGADLAVLFLHNEGYSTMCGHAIIALGRYAVDQGLVKAGEDVTLVNIECPCGMVRAEVAMQGGRPAEVSFESVPSFLFAKDKALTIGNWGKVNFDIAYGGAFYALADARQFGAQVRPRPGDGLCRGGGQPDEGGPGGGGR